MGTTLATSPEMAGQESRSRKHDRRPVNLTSVQNRTLPENIKRRHWSERDRLYFEWALLKGHSLWRIAVALDRTESACRSFYRTTRAP